jgi:NADH-quinone oxidoreductase subunit L
MSREVEHHIHESPTSMTGPLVVLAVCSLFAGFLGWPHSLGGSDRFAKFLEPVFAREAQVLTEQGRAAQVAAGEKETEHTTSTEYLLMFLSVAAGVVGWGMAWKAYRHADRGYVEPIAAAPPVYNTLLNKYYVDEGYDYVFTGRRKIGDTRLGVLGLGEASAWFDSNIVDGLVNGAGWITRLTATISSWWDKWVIDGVGVNGPAIFARVLSYPARLFEWGLVQWYALVMVAGLVYFVCLQLGYARQFWIAVTALLLFTVAYFLARYLRRRFAT